MTQHLNLVELRRAHKVLTEFMSHYLLQCICLKKLKIVFASTEFQKKKEISTNKVLKISDSLIRQPYKRPMCNVLFFKALDKTSMINVLFTKYVTH